MRTADELKAAVDSMFRVRAVESPPDARGERRIWHRGTRGAELVSVVDASGRVISHDFTLFEDVFSWHREAGVRTASVRYGEVSGGGKAAPDVVPHGAVDLQVVDRALTGLQDYAGPDRFLEHLREMVQAQRPGAPSPRALSMPVTGGALPVAAPAPKAALPSWVVPAIIGGVVALLVLGLYVVFSH